MTPNTEQYPVRATPLSCLDSTATEFGSSCWGEWNRCHRAHHLRYHLHVQQRQRPAHFGVGAAVHGGLQWWELDPQHNHWSAVLDAGLTAGALDQWTMLEVRRLLEGYEAHYGSENAGWGDGCEIVAVERAFDLGGYTGRIDLVLDVRGMIHVVDHKTRAHNLPTSVDKRAEKRREFATRPQFIALALGAQKLLGIDAPPPIIVNAIAKTKIPGYDRLAVNVTQEAADEWWKWQQRGALGDDATPCYEACAPEIGSRCWAFNWCHGSAEQRELDYVTGDVREGDEHEQPE